MIQAGSVLPAQNFRFGLQRLNTPAAVIHLDRIYIPATQPRITIASFELRYPDGPPERVMEDGRYRVF